uniref:C-type lectin domain-containing protein n=1 Tax=Sander lucioperca TaxID=283035 RepID=A0A8C9XV94_SANLU
KYYKIIITQLKKLDEITLSHFVSSSCYLLSAESGSWEKGRQYCRDRGADLMVIDSSEEQTFLSKFIKQNARYWIGLTDRDEEGTWKWVDGTPLTLKNWRRGQPDNGGGDPQWGEEDCAHIGPYTAEWNDRSCISVMYWICEKKLGESGCCSSKRSEFRV